MSLALFLVGVIAVMVPLRLLFLGEPTGGDEAGFLLVGSAWHDGASLYGDYWVDRPPLLIWIMELAGTVTNLRLVGLAACVLMVLGVSRAAFVVAGDTAARWAAAAAALFSTAHWFGVPRTNGEMLASAFVAWGFALAVQALLRPRGRSWLPAVGAGLLAAAAVLVKQTIVDGLVFLVVLAVVTGWQKPKTRRRAVTVLAWAAVGLVAGVGAGLLAATARGTTVPELFDALVTFRADAGEVIRTSASSATAHRLLVLVATWLASGLAVIAVLAAWHGLRRREPALVATLAVIVFVSAAAMLGGSYWAHYLFQLVPASALAAGLVARRLRPRPRVAIAALVVVVTAGNLVWSLVSPPHDGVQARTVGTWLRQSAQPSDTAVVAYGQPNVLSSARMTSPYPYLWSLPVRTLDPDLTLMTEVLTGPDRPTWFVDWSGVRSWGIDPAAMVPVLQRDYRIVATVCGRTIWLERGVPRALAPVKDCP
jgi:4-amino-4-deoxy-L-arabinose transferase-like glycosyltransferase